MDTKLRRRAPYLTLAVGMILGMPQAMQFSVDGNPARLWPCAIWGLLAGGSVSVLLLKARRERRNGQPTY